MSAELPRADGVDTVTRHLQGATVVAVAGVVDMATAPAVARDLRAALQGNPPVLIVDLSAVELLASAGLALLVGTHDDAAPATRVVVVTGNPIVMRPITITHVDRIVPTYTTLAEALAALRTERAGP